MNYVFNYYPIIFAYSAYFFLIEGELISDNDPVYLLESESNTLFLASGIILEKL